MCSIGFVLFFQERYEVFIVDVEESKSGVATRMGASPNAGRTIGQWMPSSLI